MCVCVCVCLLSETRVQALLCDDGKAGASCSESLVARFDKFCAQAPYISCWAVDCFDQPSKSRVPPHTCWHLDVHQLRSVRAHTGVCLELRGGKRSGGEKATDGKAWVVAVAPRGKKSGPGVSMAPAWALKQEDCCTRTSTNRCSILYMAVRAHRNHLF